MISSSIVWQDPPDFVILARADSVNLRAATVNPGISPILASSVTVPTTTTVLPLYRHAISKRKSKSTYVLVPRCLTILLRDTGGLMVLEATNRLSIVLQNLESVLLDKNLKSYTHKKSRFENKDVFLP